MISPGARRRLGRALGACLLLGSLASAVAAFAAPALDARLRLALRAGTAPPATSGRRDTWPLSGAAGVRGGQRVETRDDGWRCFITGPVAPEALRAAGIALGARAGDTWAARVPRAALPRLLRVPGLERIALAPPVRFLLDQSVRAVRADTVRRWEEGRFTGATGQGVIVGIVDSGIDVRHPDFLGADGHTRILSVWDQNDPLGPPPRDPAREYGTEWTAADIDAGRARTLDVEGHGTHVAGIAAGNGGGEHRYAGLAPNADLIVVAVAFDAASVLDGVDYVFRRAAQLGRPAVVNLSLGTQYGPHDGSDPFDRGIDALAGPGRVIVAASGNEGEDRLHAEVPLARAGGEFDLPFRVPAYPAGDSTAFRFFDLDGWYDGTDSLLVSLVTPGGARFGPFARGVGDTLLDTAEGRIALAHTRDLGQSNLALHIGNEGGPDPAPGNWILRLRPVEIRSANANFDAWLPGYSPWLPGLPGPEFSAPNFTAFLDAAEEINAPASAERVLAVGSFNSRACWPTSTAPEGQFCVPPEFGRVGEFTDFSSRGPTRSGAPKPDLVAPGFVIVSALSASLDPALREAAGILITPDAQHWIAAGTSMAAPHVAGAVALLLEAAPEATPADVRRRLHASADRDSLAGTLFDGRWGYGVLNVARLLAPDFDARQPALLAFPYPNPARGGPSRLEFLLPARAGRAAWEVGLFDIQGRPVRTLGRGTWGPEAAEGRLDWDGRDATGEPVPAGLYIARLAGPGLGQTRRLIRL